MRELIEVTLAAETRGWVLPTLLPLAPVIMAITTYFVTVEVGGNGFVAAFVCGVAFGGTVSKRAREEEFLFTEQVGVLLGLGVWFIFGAGVLAKVAGQVTWPMIAYGVLSLTVLRMLPVAIAGIGLGEKWDTVALAGWLGPRGLASIVFAILAFDDIGGEQGSFVLVVVAVTVAMSVLAHGLSAGPLAGWYAARHPVDPPAGAATPVSDPARS